MVKFKDILNQETANDLLFYSAKRKQSFWIIESEKKYPEDRLNPTTLLYKIVHKYVIA